MEKISVSLTLGKASDPHGANIGHNNREFIAWNVDQNRTHQNCTYTFVYSNFRTKRRSPKFQSYNLTMNPIGLCNASEVYQ